MFLIGHNFWKSSSGNVAYCASTRPPAICFPFPFCLQRNARHSGDRQAQQFLWRSAVARGAKLAGLFVLYLRDCLAWTTECLAFGICTFCGLSWRHNEKQNLDLILPMVPACSVISVWALILNHHKFRKEKLLCVFTDHPASVISLD